MLAMSSKVNNDLVLTDPVVKSLFANELPVYANECANDECTGDDCDISDHGTSDNEIEPDNAQSNDTHINENTPSAVDLIHEQRDDDTLKQCWSWAAVQKGG